MPDLEGDMLRAVAALSSAVDFLQRYDRLQAALLVDRAAIRPSPLTEATEDGLAAAHRVLAGLRGPNGRGPVRTEPRIPAQRVPDDRRGDPGE